MSDYVLTTEDIFMAFQSEGDGGISYIPGLHTRSEFDTWLNSVKADAFSEGAAKQREIVEHKLGYGQTIVIPNNPYRNGGKNV